MSTPTEPIDTLARIQEASFARGATGKFPPERRMTGAQLLSFLSSRRTGVLATVRPDGRPHAAPIGYAVVGTKLVFATLQDAARVRNLRHEPHASLVVSADDDSAVVIAEGTTRLARPLEVPLEMRAPFRDAQGNLPEWVGMLIMLTPERLLSYTAPGTPL